MRRLGEGKLRRRLVSGFGVDTQIGAVLVPDERCSRRQRLRRPHHGGQRVVRDHEASSSVHRLPQCLGDHHSDRLADIAGFTERQNRVRRDQERRAVAALERHLMRVRWHRPLGDRLQTILRRVAGGQHSQDTRHTGRRPDIDAENPGMRVRRANHIGIGLARQAHVVGVVAGTGQKARVLAPPDWFADPLHRHPLPRSQERHRSPARRCVPI